MMLLSVHVTLTMLSMHMHMIFYMAETVLATMSANSLTTTSQMVEQELVQITEHKL